MTPQLLAEISGETWQVGPNVFASPPTWFLALSAVVIVFSLSAIARALRG